MFIVDSHCHLDALDYENLHKDIADVVAKAQARDVKHLLAIGVTLGRFEKAYPELAKFPNVSNTRTIWALNILSSTPLARIFQK